VDTWNSDGMSGGRKDVFADFQANTKVFKSVIETVRGLSVEAAARFELKINLLWIDGDHSYEGCKSDIIAWLPKVFAGGCVAFHDYGNPCGVRQAVDELFLPRAKSWYRVDS